MPSKKSFLLTLIIALFLLLPLQAYGATSNVTGFAWSEIVGWISFNNTSGGGSIEYGVYIDPTDGVISGYAWSENAGWISFNREDTGAPPLAPYNTNEAYVAQMNTTSGALSGWARALAYQDGWIKWSGTATQDQSSYGVTVNLTTGRFSGWAWGGETLGWIMFDCANNATCGTVTYTAPSSGSSPTTVPPSSGGGMIIPLTPTPPSPPPIIAPPAVRPSQNSVAPAAPSLGGAQSYTFTDEARIAASGSIKELLSINKAKRDIGAEIKAVKTVNATLGASKPSKSTHYAMINFIAYGTPRTARVSFRTRGWVLSSFKDSLGKVPENQKDWEDVLKLTTGMSPIQRSKRAEDEAVKIFETIYKRKPNRANKKDDAAMLLITYGIRPQRDPNREAHALKIFSAIYKRGPESDKDWNIVRAIAYSGATR